MEALGSRQHPCCAQTKYTEKYHQMGANTAYNDLRAALFSPASQEILRNCFTFSAFRSYVFSFHNHQVVATELEKSIHFSMTDQYSVVYNTSRERGDPAVEECECYLGFYLQQQIALVSQAIAACRERTKTVSREANNAVPLK